MKRLLFISCLALIFMPTINGSEGIKVADWEFEEVRSYFVISLFIFCLLIIKLIHWKINWIGSHIPESFILLLIGVIFGLIYRFGVKTRVELTFEPNLFFLILLPPIILNSAYEMMSRSFYKVCGICIMFAVLGTVLNFLLIGFTLFGVFSGGVLVYGMPELYMSLNSILLFASLIVAVDPVAVLAIFNEIGVNQELYFIVFGESLFNDAVTVVIYDIMSKFMNLSVITSLDIGLGIISFFTVSLGGLLIGLIFGVITCLITKYETNTEVVTVLILSYLSYILADTIKWSGIISIIACGMVQADYVFNNISPESVMVIKKVVEIWANISESIIFLFLGESLVHIEKGWHTGFILWSLAICFVVRAIVAFLLVKLNNFINLENKKINWKELIIIIYGGLRGAVAFSLAVLIDPKIMYGDSDEEKLRNTDIIKSATLFIILFTVAVHGLTMKPLVKLLNIQKKETEDLSLFNTTNLSIIDNLLPAVEGICGDLGENVIREKLVRFDDKYIRPLLQKNIDKTDDGLMRVMEKISLAMHYAMIKPKESQSYLSEIPERMRSHGSFLHPFFDDSEQNLSADSRSKNKVTPVELIDTTQYTSALERQRKQSNINNYNKKSLQYYKQMHTIIKDKQKSVHQIYGSKKINKNCSQKSLGKTHNIKFTIDEEN